MHDHMREEKGLEKPSYTMRSHGLNYMAMIAYLLNMKPRIFTEAIFGKPILTCPHICIHIQS